MDSCSPDPAKLHNRLLEADDTPLLELARMKKGVLSQLTALTYDPVGEVSTRVRTGELLAIYRNAHVVRHSWDSDSNFLTYNT